MCGGMLCLQYTLYTSETYLLQLFESGLYMLYRNFDGLIPDAPELIHTYLEGEQDASCKRNAFMMLIHVDRVSYGVLMGGREGGR